MINLWMLPSRQSYIMLYKRVVKVIYSESKRVCSSLEFFRRPATGLSSSASFACHRWPSPRWSQPRSRRSSPPTRMLLAGGTNSWGLTVIADKFFPAIHACFKHVPNTFSGTFVRLGWDSKPTLVQADYCITAKFSDHPGPHLAAQGLIMACWPCNSWKTTNRLWKTREVSRVLMECLAFADEGIWTASWWS